MRKLGLPLLAGLLYAPFLAKPLHIDDPYFVTMSQHLGWNPLVAEPLNHLYMGRELVGLLPYELTHPVGVLWALKLARALFGESELALHAAFLCFPLLALVGLADLARLYLPSAPRRLLAMAALLLAAPLLVASHGLMTDYPTMALLLFGTGRLLTAAHAPGGGRAKAALGGLALTAAGLFSYQALFLPVLLLATAPAPRRALVRVAAATPLVAMGLYLALVFHHHGILPFFASSLNETGAGPTADLLRGLPPVALARKLIASLAAVGLAAALPLAWRLAEAPHPWRGALTFAAAAGLLRLLVPALPPSLAPIVPRLGAPALKGAGALHLAVLTASGLAALTLAGQGARELRRSGRPRAALFLTLWIAAVLGYCTLLLPFGAARYIIPLVPPLLLLILLPSPAVPSQRIPKACALAASILVALGVATADLQLARSYRDAPERALAELPRLGAAPSARLYFVGEWGLRHYALQEGARYLLARSTDPRPGDFILAPTTCRFWSPTRELGRRLSPAFEWEERPAAGFRIFDPWSGAGFYSDPAGLLPARLGTTPIEKFTLFRVGE